MNLPGLNLIERLALWVLFRSPRVGMVIVKRYGLDLTAFSVAPTDLDAVDLAHAITRRATQSELEPPSMLFERMFHAPSYGEKE